MRFRDLYRKERIQLIEEPSIAVLYLSATLEADNGKELL
jgi:hypothetical protein